MTGPKVSQQDGALDRADLVFVSDFIFVALQRICTVQIHNEWMKLKLTKQLPTLCYVTHISKDVTFKCVFLFPIIHWLSSNIFHEAEIVKFSEISPSVISLR